MGPIADDEMDITRNPKKAQIETQARIKKANSNDEGYNKNNNAEQEMAQTQFCEQFSNLFQEA